MIQGPRGTGAAVCLRGNGDLRVKDTGKPPAETDERLSFVFELHDRKTVRPIQAQSVLVEPENMLVL
jgi:hypothetical protein